MGVIGSIARVTFREIVTDKILYNVFLCAALLFGVTYLTSRLTFMGQDRIVMDMGLMTLGLSTIAVAIFTGAPLLAREVDRRTIQISMSRPVGGLQFLLGKYAGLLAVLSANWAIITVVYLAILLLFGGEISATLVWGILLILFEGALAGAVVVFLSTFTTTSLSVVMSIGLFLVGQNVSHIRLLAEKMEGTVLATLLTAVAGLLPNYEYFSLGTKVTYGLPIAVSYGLTAVVYAVIYSAALLFVAPLFMRFREWN